MFFVSYTDKDVNPADIRPPLIIEDGYPFDPYEDASTDKTPPPASVITGTVANSTDDYAGDATTTGVLVLDGAASTGNLELAGDDDWFAITVEAGDRIIFSLTGDTLSDPYLRLYNENGSLLAENDDFGSLDSQISYTFSSAGTYYLSARAYADAYSGTYSLSAETAPPPDPIDALNWGSPVTGAQDPGTLTINYFFQQATSGFLGSIEALDWTTYEMDQFRLAFEVMERYIDVEFVEVDSADDATFVLAIENNAGAGYSAFMYPPGTGPNEGVSVYNRASSIFTEANNTWDLGGIGFEVVFHEIGHGLGLAHPHDNGGSSQIMQGVFGSSSYGDFNLNQGIFTVMSYNSGWELSPNGTPAALAYGYMASFGPLDLALLQEWYGANPTTGSGDDTYVLPDGAGAGVYYETIWDVGGQDTIQAGGDSDAIIDLRAATVAYEDGGGGFVSYADGVVGGFVIAEGVVIENAIGGRGDDEIIGNAADNVLEGGRGADTLRGGAGFDTASYESSSGFVIVNLSTGSALRNDALGDQLFNIENLTGSAFDDTLAGNDNANVLTGLSGDDNLRGLGGDDTLIGGTGSDTIYGGAGIDTASYAASAGSVVVNLRSQNNLRNDAAGDTMFSIENLTGSNFNDFLTGTGQANTLVGGNGNDSLRGLGGDDTLIGGNGNDRLEGHGGRDVFEGGAGSDTFVFAQGNSGHDTITDFSVTNDTLDLSGLNAAFASLQALYDATSVVNGDDLLITINNNTSVLLEDTTLEDLMAADVLI